MKNLHLTIYLFTNFHIKKPRGFHLSEDPRFLFHNRMVILSDHKNLTSSLINKVNEHAYFNNTIFDLPSYRIKDSVVFKILQDPDFADRHHKPTNQN